MANPTLDASQIQALKDALKQLDDLDAQINAASKAGLDVSSRQQQAAEHRKSITQLLQVYAPGALSTKK